MTTLVLQAAGSAIGSFFGGPIGAMVGRAAGALAGSVIDSTLFAGKPQITEGPRLKEMDGLASSEGAAIPRLYGRARLGGQLIWATRFEEHVTMSTRKASGGKGLSGTKTRERTYNYYANLAIGLCDGPISFVRRVWADGREIDLTRLTMRVYRGDDAQMPDALIVAKEGAANAPAYRGTAYVVFERMPLADYGNRVPQLSFEVVRALPGLPRQVRAVNLIPGSSEFAYQTGTVTRPFGLGNTAPENRHQLQASSDVIASLDQLQALCPNLGTIQIITSWFGDDLRAGNCTIAPRVDNAIKVTDGATWGVAGLTRTSARLVTQVDGRAAYGGTPSDASLLALIAEIKRRGLKVVLYPFIMMDVGPGNTLPNPHGGIGQPALPWRGRITCSPAPGQAGTVDVSAAAVTQVSAFVGTVTTADMTLNGTEVVCAKPNEWSFRRHILHHARLAEAAGGVDGFVIGSEMVGLSRVRSASGVYPFVSALQALAVDARAMLGANTRITYAADWTEYGAHVLAGGQEVRFPLDPLWASPAISTVGIDYYAPISDWRDGVDHLDAAIARSHHDADYLSQRQTSGEAFDWFYTTDAARRAQTRTLISDGAINKPWVFRQKDMAGWWLNSHRERVAGAELGSDTAWVPGSKPIWLTEVGCPAVDKGANAPNVFPDPKSSENALPFFSSGERDDLAQVRALEAQLGVFDPASPRFRGAANPLNVAGTLRMIAPADTAIWAWDARPFPTFPMLASVWSDGGNWQTGHWLNGRLEAVPLDNLVSAILADFGLGNALKLDIDHLVDGYVVDRPMSARAALEPLARLFGLDASFDEGRLVLRGQGGRAPVPISAEQLVPDRDGKPFEIRRAQETELPRELRIGFVDGNWDYRSAASRSRRLAGGARREVALDAAVVTSRADADRLAEQRLKDAWIGRESLSFRVSPRQIALEPGDAITIEIAAQTRLFRITEVADGDVRRMTAVSAERSTSKTPVRSESIHRVVPVPALAGKPFAVALELPFQRGTEPVLHYLAAYADPWPGSLDVLRQTDGTSFDPFTSISQPALVGRLASALQPGPVWRWDRSATFDIEIEAGNLQSVSDVAALGGANTFAVLGPDGAWELLSAASVTLIAPRRYRLSRLVRGLGGSEPAASRPVTAGALIVGVDEALVPLGSGLADLGRSIRLRVVPAGLDAADPSVLALDAAPLGVALRPLAPVHVKARRSAAGVAISWIRRTRIDGDNWQLAEPPVGEASERYQLQLFAGAVLKRQVDVTTPVFLYTQAAETADFGGPQTLFDIAVAQISESVGPGTVRRAVVDVA